MSDVSTATKHFPVANENYASNLSATILSNAAVVPAVSTSAYAEGDVVVLTVDPSTPQEATFTGTKSGNTYVDCKWTEGNLGVGHSNGAPIIDYDSATHYNLLSKAMRKEHNQDGSHKNIVSPTGSIVGFGANTAPEGWLICEGQVISRTAYATLFAVIGITYGAGDGSATFNLPNLKGRIPVGRDAAQAEFDALNETGGAKTHTLTTAEMPSHDHGAPTTNGINGSAVEVPLASSSGFDYIGGAPTSSTGGGAAHNNLQPYIVINYIIKM